MNILSQTFNNYMLESFALLNWKCNKKNKKYLIQMVLQGMEYIYILKSYYFSLIC